jgi:hypothetical protein
MPASTPEHIAREAHKLLGDAADWLRYPDWLRGHTPTVGQVAALRRAINLIGEAKAALDEVQRAAR